MASEWKVGEWGSGFRSSSRLYRYSLFSTSRMIFFMVSTTRAGCIPVAVSPLSITASAPSITALATSVVSLRLGLIRSIIDSIICVATMTGFARCRHLRISCFWISGTCSTGISTPRSPRATMMPSDSRMISRIFVSASGFSILAITLVFDFFSDSLLLMITMSFTLRTKESATQSSFCSMMNSRSTRSFSVNAGKEILVSGKLIPFLEEITPPMVTCTFTLPSFPISFTCTSIFPSSIMILLPIRTSPARLG